jgi:tetratricopeptide (TPR) repeat protein
MLTSAKLSGETGFGNAILHPDLSAILNSCYIHPSMSTANPLPSRLPKGPQILLFLFGIAMYASTLLNGYALDDRIVITQNEYTQQGFSGIPALLSKDGFAGFMGEDKSLLEGGRYRPLSLVTFAMEVGIFGKDHPGISHLLNVLIFALTGWLLFRLLVRLLPLPEGKPVWSSVAFMATALFIVHPLHTEAVANIKGRDELLALLFAVLATTQCLRFVTAGKPLDLMGALAFGLLAFFSKESAMPLLAAAPLLMWFAGGKPELRKIVLPTAALALGAGIYLLARYGATAGSSAISPELLNNPFRDASMAERIATAFLCMGKDLKLLLIPYPLTHDYYPFQIEITGFGNALVLVSVLIHLVMVGAGIWLSKKGKPLGWALLWYLLFLLPVSNLLVNTGVFMAERFLYLPSVGAVVVLALGIQALAGVLAKVSAGPDYGAKAGVLVVIVFAFGLLTQLRNPAWKDDFTLFTTDVEVSSRSARAQMAAGGAYLTASRDSANLSRRTFLLNESISHLDEALKLYPDYAAAWLLKGNAVLERTGDIAKARACFNKALSLQEMPEARRNLENLEQRALAQYTPADGNSILRRTEQSPDDPDGWFHLGIHYQRINNISASRNAFEKALSLKPDHAQAMGELGILLGMHYQDFPKSIEKLNQAIALPGGQQEHFYKNLGIAYGMSKDYTNSERVLKEGIRLFPNSSMLHQTLAATYENQGRLDEARQEMLFVK